MPSVALSHPTATVEVAAPAPVAVEPLTVRVFNDLGAAEAIWRDLEGRAVLTPYQRFDWIAAWLDAATEPVALAIVVIEQAGRPVALLPLMLENWMGLRRATIVGSDIGNADFLIVAPEAGAFLTRATLRVLLDAARAEVGGIDLIAFFNQPESWAGVENPLLSFDHQVGPNHLYLGSLGDKGSFDRFDEKRLGNLMRRRRKLGESAGPVVLRAASTAAEIDRFHRVFLEQRAARFAKMGIDNVFAEPRFVRFFRDGAIASLGQQRPALIFHALFAGDEIVATACGTFAGTHYSQYINATAEGEVAKFRLIGLLMHALFADVAARGGTSIDMGLGDFEYKTDWTVATPVYDSIIPLTLRGRIAGWAILLLRRLKRAIKQHDRLWALVRKVRAAFRSGPAPAVKQEE